MWNNKNDVYLNFDDEEEIKKILLGHKVKVKNNNGQEAILILDNNVKLLVEANYGCGGCNNGWYSINKLNEVDNAITNVEFVCESDDKYEEDKSYKIFVFCEDKRINLLEIDGTDGNGYYGTGYTIRVKKTYFDKIIKKEG